MGGNLILRRGCLAGPCLEKGFRDEQKVSPKMRRTFCCPSNRKYDDGESDDDVEDLPHDGVWGERVNPGARD